MLDFDIKRKYFRTELERLDEGKFFNRGAGGGDCLFIGPEYGLATRFPDCHWA